MRCAKYLVPLAVALLFSYALAAEEGEKRAKGEGGVYGVLSAAPAGGDAKVLGVIKMKSKDGEKSVNVLAANDEVGAKIKELVAKGARVAIRGEKSADGSSITVSKIEEAGGKRGDKEHKEGK